jgi:MoaA/NifB/PqqE/SkfB family radical SAM enzyme
MTAKNCNLKCKHCYIDFKENKKVKDYIPIEKVKQALSILKRKYKIYTPIRRRANATSDFNSILRLCLKYASVVIHTNGMNIMIKKQDF